MTPETLLLRQINPNWIQAGRVTSQAFHPFPKDQLRLSVYDGDQIAPEKSWLHFTQKQGFKSCGVLAVTSKESTSNGLGVEPDPEPYPEHVVIVFKGLDKSTIKRMAKVLTAFATSRGWLFVAEPA